MNNSNDPIETIVNFLKSSKSGSTPSEIARKTGINRMTVSKYLNILKAINFVSYRGVGMAKVYFLNETPLLAALCEPDSDYLSTIKRVINDLGIGVAIMDKSLNVVWHNKNVEDWVGSNFSKVKGQPCFSIYKNNKCVCVGCPSSLTLKDGKVHSAVQPGIDKNNKVLLFYLISSPLYDVNNKVSGVVEIVKNLSDFDDLVEQVNAVRSKLKC